MGKGLGIFSMPQSKPMKLSRGCREDNAPIYPSVSSLDFPNCSDGISWDHVDSVENVLDTCLFRIDVQEQELSNPHKMQLQFAWRSSLRSDCVVSAVSRLLEDQGVFAVLLKPSAHECRFENQTLLGVQRVERNDT